MNALIFIVFVTVIVFLFATLSLIGQWLQRRRDAVNAFAAMVDKLPRPSDMPHHTRIPNQPHHRRHAR